MSYKYLYLYKCRAKLYIENYITIGTAHLEIDKDKIEFIEEDKINSIFGINKILYNDFIKLLFNLHIYKTINLGNMGNLENPIYIYKYEHIYVGINFVKIIIFDTKNNKIIEKMCDGRIIKTYIYKYISPNTNNRNIKLINEYDMNDILYSRIIIHKDMDCYYIYKNNKLEEVDIYYFINNDYYSKIIDYNYKDNIIIKKINEWTDGIKINKKYIKTCNNKLIYI